MNTRVLPLMLIRTSGLPAYAPDAWADDWTAMLHHWQLLRNHRDAARMTLIRQFDQTLQTLPPSGFRTLLYRHRRAFFSQGKPIPDKHLDEYRQHPTEALLHAHQRWQEKNAAEQACARHLHELFEQQSAMQTELPEALLKGLLYAAPDFLEYLLKGKYPEGKKARQRCLTLVQYASRAAFKTSPFSHFTTVGTPAPQHDEAAFSSLKTQVTPNVALLPFMYEVLLQTPAFYRSLSLRLNPSGYFPTHKQWEYIDYAGDTENFQRIRTDALINALIRHLGAGNEPITFPELQRWITEQTDADAPAAETYVFKLIDIGLLEWDLPEKGLSTSWAGNLYQFLGFLPGEPQVLETLRYLQWLRGAARALPWQPLPEALQTLKDGVKLFGDYCELFGIDAAPPEPRHLFYEDIEAPVKSWVPAEVMSSLAGELSEWLQTQSHLRTTGLRAAFYQYAEKKLTGAPPSRFLPLAKKFIQQYKHKERSCNIPLQPGPTGALLQVYQENGRWRAVVNALYPGGGKLMARWLHLLPATATRTLQDWCADTLAYPWQGWSNAGFQPPLSPRSIAAPGGRTSGKQALRLADLYLSFREGRLILSEGPEGAPLRLNDAGLEAADSRQPVQRLLAIAGVPFIGRSALPDFHRPWQFNGKYWKYRPRLEYGALVLERQTWQLMPDFWKPAPTETPLEQFVSLRTALQTINIPRRFFLTLGSERPEYIDQESPVLMRYLARILRLNTEPVLITEMLPLPEQCSAVSALDGTARVTEWVVEWV